MLINTVLVDWENSVLICTAVCYYARSQHFALRNSGAFVPQSFCGVRSNLKRYFIDLSF